MAIVGNDVNEEFLFVPRKVCIRAVKERYNFVYILEVLFRRLSK